MRWRSSTVGKRDESGQFLPGMTLIVICILVAALIVARQSREISIETGTPAGTGVENTTEDHLAANSSAGAGSPALPHPLTSGQSYQEDKLAEAAWAERFRTIPHRPLADDYMVGEFTVAEHREFKEQYYCDLALQAREQCDALSDDAAYQQCLSLRSYYTFSRHCGYLP